MSYSELLQGLLFSDELELFDAYYERVGNLHLEVSNRKAADPLPGKAVRFGKLLADTVKRPFRDIYAATHAATMRLTLRRSATAASHTRKHS